MRVISGTAKSTLLVAPKGMKTRPTSDRAKESLFNMLAAHIKNASFLDLFCGSGAMGIEALSRGAKEVVFVDNAPSARNALSENLAKTRLIDSGAEIMGVSAKNAIRQLSATGRMFDIIFIDPPYDINGTDFLGETFNALATANIVSENGIVIAETDKSVAPPNSEAFTLTNTRNYGRTNFLFYNPLDF